VRELKASAWFLLPLLTGSGKDGTLYLSFRFFCLRCSNFSGRELKAPALFLFPTLCLFWQLPESDIGDTFPTYAPLWPDLAAGSLGGQKSLSPPVIHRGGELCFYLMKKVSSLLFYLHHTLKSQVRDVLL